MEISTAILDWDFTLNCLKLYTRGWHINFYSYRFGFDDNVLKSDSNFNWFWSSFDIENIPLSVRFISSFRTTRSSTSPTFKSSDSAIGLITRGVPKLCPLARIVPIIHDYKKDKPFGILGSLRIMYWACLFNLNLASFITTSWSFKD